VVAAVRSRCGEGVSVMAKGKSMQKEKKKPKKTTKK
jgi:hypothetical protein